MPPGFANQCPNGLELSFTPWVTLAWVTVYALCAETLLIGLESLVLRRRRTVPRGAPLALLLVVGCAGGATAVAEWMTYFNLQACFDFPLAPAHFAPAAHAEAERVYAELLGHVHSAAGILAALFIIATALTAVTLVRGGHRGVRTSEQTPA